MLRFFRSSTAVFAVMNQLRLHSDNLTGDRNRPLNIHWVLPDGAKKSVTGYVGQTLVDVAVEHDLPIEAACAQSCACSTCHVYVNEEDYDKFPEPSDEENDMIDMAYMPHPLSRLGCQLKLGEEHEGSTFRLPKASRNMAVDGFVAKPH